MIESHQEHHPLLCDEYSDEELHIPDNSPRFYRRLRHSISKGRARTHAIGATAIISRWPDHLSSILAYWWVGFGMIAVMVFLIYNSIVAITMLPPANDNKPFKVQNLKHMTENKSSDNPSTPNIYMHVFVSNFDEFNIDNNIKYLEKIAKKYHNFKYNFIVLLNDIALETSINLSDETKNEIAFNTLRSDNKIKIKKKLFKNFAIKFNFLSKYLDNSPLKKYWRILPYQFIGFLSRSVAIWETGGVAFNPVILSPNTPSPFYIEKLNGILSNFQSKNHFSRTRKTPEKPKRKFNNIRDIINNLENGDKDNIIFPDNLSEAENVNNVNTVPASKIKRNANLFDRYSSENITKFKLEYLLENTSYSKDNKNINTTQLDSVQTKQYLLPKILDFIFHFNTKNSTTETENFKKSNVNMSHYENVKSNIQTNNNFSHNATAATKTDLIKIESNKKQNNKIFNGNESTKLFLDLKGNLIATEIGCHAFIGTVFSNVLHHTDEESLTDFIITELSLFCKGSLSNCNGIEIILL